jgi:hypothetical protein
VMLFGFCRVVPTFQRVSCTEGLSTLFLQNILYSSIKLFINTFQQTVIFNTYIIEWRLHVMWNTIFFNYRNI